MRTIYLSIICVCILMGCSTEEQISLSSLDIKFVYLDECGITDKDNNGLLFMFDTDGIILSRIYIPATDYFNGCYYNVSSVSTKTNLLVFISYDELEKEDMMDLSNFSDLKQHLVKKSYHIPLLWSATHVPGLSEVNSFVVVLPLIKVKDGEIF